ncbi:MAG: DUF1585 domain-containing protein, partial [Myxococcota bacterium]
AACHATMDPVGLAFEAFGPLGRGRDVDELGRLVDTATTLPDGTPLDGIDDAVAWVRNHPSFPTCITQKAMVFALGQSPEELDRCAVDAVEEAFVEGGGTMRALVHAIATSPGFRQHRAPIGGR